MSHLQSHIESHDTSELIPCKHCDLSVKGKEDLDEHMIDKHGEVVIIHTMCRQLEDMDEDCKQMKNILKNLLEDNNAIKQELFLIRNNQANNTEKKEAHMANIHQDGNSFRNIQVVSSNRVHSIHLCEANKCRIFKPFFLFIR